jgi:hypothetical protein
MVYASPPFRHRLPEEKAPHHSPMTPLTVTGLDKLECPIFEIGWFGFYSFEQRLSVPIHFMWQHILTTPLGNRLLQTR